MRHKPVQQDDLDRGRSRSRHPAELVAQGNQLPAWGIISMCYFTQRSAKVDQSSRPTRNRILCSLTAAAFLVIGGAGAASANTTVPNSPSAATSASGATQNAIDFLSDVFADVADFPDVHDWG
ncbi:hypothetical protein [Streptomyces rochei]|uniref:hypothetical protein n=1 Tax=Streptomyces rochei TaxID=1928 RepID=UPI00369ABAB6